MTVEYDDSDWKNALFVIGGEFDWKKICILLGQVNPSLLHDLAMESVAELVVVKIEFDPRHPDIITRYRLILNMEGAIPAIKALRLEYGLGLKDSKDFIDSLR